MSKRECSNCKEDCPNCNFSNSIKNYYDMHLCKIYVILKLKLSWLKISNLLHIKIIGLYRVSTGKRDQINLFNWSLFLALIQYLPQNALNTYIPNVSKLNLTTEI